MTIQWGRLFRCKALTPSVTAEGWAEAWRTDTGAKWLPRFRWAAPVPEEKPVFESSHPFAFFDYFRVPCAVRPALAADHRVGTSVSVHRLRVTGQPGGAARSLLWLGTDVSPAAWPTTCRLGRYQLRDCTFVRHVALDAAVPCMLRQLGHGWHPAERIFDGAGQPQAAIWRDSDGSAFLPFDPGEVMQEFWSEGYRQVGRSPMALTGRSALLRGYYLLRPALPRRLQLRLRRAFTRVQARSSFPSWPVEDSLHILYEWLFGLLAERIARRGIERDAEAQVLTGDPVRLEVIAQGQRVRDRHGGEQREDEHDDAEGAQARGGRHHCSTSLRSDSPRDSGRGSPRRWRWTAGRTRAA